MLKKFWNPVNKRFYDAVLHINDNGKPMLSIWRGGQARKVDEHKEFDDLDTALREMERKEKRRLQRGYVKVN